MGEKLKLVKTNSPGLAKDVKSGAILATNDGEYKAILAKRKEKAEREKSLIEIITLKRQVAALEEEIRKIKEIVGL